MRYAILTNPATGKLSVDRKRIILSEPSQILKAPVFGLDAETPEDAEKIAKELVRDYDVIVAAGGDGTLSDVINAVDTSRTPVAYLPIGSGNAMKYALRYQGNLCDIAKQISKGAIHEYDLISCDEKKRGYMISAGIDGTALRMRNHYLSSGMKGFPTYFLAFLNACFISFKRAGACISADGVSYDTGSLLSLMIMKQPFYGYGLKMMPKAQFDDGKIHGMIIDSHLLKIFAGIGMSFSDRNIIGRCINGSEISLKTSVPLILQIDGNIAWTSDCFSFKVLSKALKIKY